jgi:Na+/H+-dicarboxylate symporter
MPEPESFGGRVRRRLTGTGASLTGLAAGLALGILAYRSGHAGLLSALAILEPIGTLWVNALRMTIVPLAVANLIVAVAGSRNTAIVGRLGALSFLSFLGLLVIGGIFTLTFAPLFVSPIPAGASAIEALRANLTPPPGIVVPDPANTSRSIWQGIVGFVPSNPVQAAAAGDLLPLIVFTLLFGLAATRLPLDSRRLLVGVSEAVAATMLVLVRWVLAVAPAGVFVLAFGVAAKVGVEAVQAVGYYLVLVCGFLLAFTALLYPLTGVAGRVPIARFAAAVAPAQAVAIGTRSSLACLPALLQGAERQLRMTPVVSGFTLPLAVATFKVNRTISSPIKLLFLTHLFGLHVDPVFVAGFMLFVIVLSFSAPGIPGGAPMLTLPAYLAAGIPIEALLLMEAVEAIPDIFKTLLNATADMSSAAIVARLMPAPAGDAAEILAPVPSTARTLETAR